MGQQSHTKYKEYKNAESKLRSYSSTEKKQEVENLKLQYEMQLIKDDRDEKRTNDLFDRYSY